MLTGCKYPDLGDASSRPATVSFRHKTNFAWEVPEKHGVADIVLSTVGIPDDGTPKGTIKKEFSGLSSPVVHLMMATAVHRKQGFDMQRLQLLGCLSPRAVHNSNSACSQHQGADGRRTGARCWRAQVVALAGVSRAPHFLSFEPPLPSWSDLLTHISSHFHSFHSALMSIAISLFRTTRFSDKWRLFVTFNNET